MPAEAAPQTPAPVKVSSIPATFAFGGFCLLYATVLELTTYTFGMEVKGLSLALLLSINANICFIYLCWRGGWLVRVFALPCELAAGYGALGLLKWAAMKVHLF